MKDRITSKPPKHGDGARRVLNRKQGNILFIAIMALSMSLVMSLVMTAVNTPLDARFVDRWLRSFLIAYVVAFPTALMIVPAVRRFVDRLVA